MTTLLQDESGVATSIPREGFKIFTGAKTYRIASGDRNLTILGDLYVAGPISRTELKVPQVGDSGEVEMSLPLSHELCQRYLAIGVPPRSIVVSIYRKQRRSGEAERVWYGRIHSMRIVGHLGVFRIPSTFSEMGLRKIPTITAGRNCPHILYEGPCRVLRSSFVVLTSVVAVDGRAVIVSSLGIHPTGWANMGELLHTLSGERMTILDQTGTGILIQLPIYEIAENDDVQIFAGCDHTMDETNGCQPKFNNAKNYGGMPHAPTRNIFLPNGFGIYTSEN